MGAGVPPSPRISVVIPWVTLLTSRPSPNRKEPPDWPWMSMKPGATTRPVASTRFWRGRVGQHAPGRHGHDAVAADPHVAVVPRRAGAVDDPAVCDDHVVGAGDWRGPAAHRGAGAADQGDECGDGAEAAAATEERVT